MADHLLAGGPPLTTRPKNRKAIIVAAAADLFAESGYAAVGVGDIGQRVGITGGAIYRHFPGKEAVLAAVLEDGLLSFESDVSAVANPGFDALLQAGVMSILERPGATQTYLRDRSRLGGEAADGVRRSEARISKGWLELLRAETPDVTPTIARLREYAIVGAVAAAARSSDGVDERRRSEIVLRSAKDVARVPVAAEVGDDSPGNSRGRQVEESPWKSRLTKSDRILEAALALFRERGVSGVGMDEIGEAVGISGPTVYHYFPSKAALVLTAYDRVGERVAAGAHDAIASGKSPSDAVHRLARSYVDIAVDSVDLIVVTSREWGALPPEELPRLGRRQRDVRDRWVSVVAELRPDLSDAEVRLLVRMVFPLIRQAAEVAEGDAGLVAECVALVEAHIGAATTRSK